MVPSLTETLLEAGVNVVGRTRYCIHPSRQVSNIAVVGGTKDIDWAKVKSLGADLLIVDKEENPKSFADKSPIPFLATHTEDISSLIETLKLLNLKLGTPKLGEYVTRFQNLKKKKIPLSQFVNWVGREITSNSRLEYIIWKDPLMAVGRDTYIGSVLDLLGHELPQYETKYPKLSEKLEESTTYLFSSEPYPFLKRLDWIKSQDAATATVDGECFSWFGIRSLNFLEKMLK
jgi:hypothetical protein